MTESALPKLRAALPINPALRKDLRLLLLTGELRIMFLTQAAIDEMKKMASQSRLTCHYTGYQHTRQFATNAKIPRKSICELQYRKAGTRTWYY